MTDDFDPLDALDELDHQRGLTHYDRDGNPMTLRAWAVACGRDAEEFEASRRVALDTVTAGGRRFRVSTVWLGLDHGFGRGAPLIFETMVFDDGRTTWRRPRLGSPADLTWRYATEADALAGHAEAVAIVADPKRWGEA